MTDNVTKLYTANAAKNPDNVLEQAIGEYDRVAIVGYNKSGEMEFRASTNFSEEAIYYALGAFKVALIEAGYADD